MWTVVDPSTGRNWQAVFSVVGYTAEEVGRSAEQLKKGFAWHRVL